MTAPGLYRGGFFGTLLVAVLVIVLGAVAMLQPHTMQHPLLQIETVVSLGSEGGQSPLRLTMLMDGQPSAERCERTARFARHRSRGSTISPCSG